MRMILVNNVPHVDLEGAAAFCNATTVTIRNWLRQENPPPVADNMLFPVKELGEWCRREQIYKAHRGGGYPYMPDMTRYGGVAKSDVVQTKQSAEVLLKTAQAEKVQIEVAQMRGELVPARAVELAISSSNSIVKSLMLSLPTKLAPLVLHSQNVQDARELMESHIRDVLTELSDSWQDRLRDGDDDEPAD